MGRPARKPEEPAPGLPAWMATFSDMVTLLLTFFVMMMAMANFDDSKQVEAVIQSLRDALGVGGFDDSHLQAKIGKMATDDTKQQETVAPRFAQLRAALQAKVSDAYIVLSQDEQTVRVLLDDRIFFKAGSVELAPAGLAAIDDLGKELFDEDVAIEVHGYTDATGPELDNWRLSSARATSVVMALRVYGPIDGHRLSAIGHGSYVPNDSFEGDAAYNRRIELVITGEDVMARSAIERVQAKEGGDGG